MHFSMISLMLQHKCSNMMCTLYYRRCGCLENKVPIDWLSSYWRHVVPIDCNKRLAEKPKQVMLQRIFVDMVPRYLEVSVLCHIWYLDFCVKFVFSPFQCCVHFASCCMYLGTISVLGKKSAMFINLVHTGGLLDWFGPRFLKIFWTLVSVESQKCNCHWAEKWYSFLTLKCAKDFLN